MCPPRRDRAAPERRFVLATTPEEGDPVLLPEEAEHALRVLRVGVGDHLVGLDGRGGLWPLEVTATERRRLELRPRGEPRRESAPGTPGAPVPWIEVFLPLPRAGRAEQLVDRLTQLGVSRLVPLITSRTAPHARELSLPRLEKLRRTAREALKQCGRAWLPEIAEPTPLDQLTHDAGVRLLLDADAEWSLSEVLIDATPPQPWSEENPLVLIAGPEGGLEEEEIERLRESGVERVRLAPYTLRIETAAEAAVAIVVNLAGWSPRRSWRSAPR